GGAVGQVPARGQPADGRADVDDRAATRREQVRYGGPGERVRRAHVEVERLLEVRRVGVHQRVRDRPADVVHDDVEPAELVDRGVGQAGGRVEVAEVGLDDVRPPAGGGDPVGHLRELRGVPGGDHHVRTGLGEGDRAGGADAAARPGDHGDLAVHLEEIE